MNFPKDLKYTSTHEWIKINGDEVEIGLTDYAQSELGDLVFVNLPEIGDEIKVSQVFADVESVKAVSDVLSPVNGIIVEINEELLDAPEKINESPYDAWFVRIGNTNFVEALMSADEYGVLVKSLS